MRVVRADQNHAAALLNVLNDLTEFNHLVQIIKHQTGWSRFVRLSYFDLVLGFELVIGTRPLIALFVQIIDISNALLLLRWLLFVDRSEEHTV